MSTLPRIVSLLENDCAPEVAREFISLVTEYLADTRDRRTPVTTDLAPPDLARTLAEPLPREGHPVAEVVRRLREDVIPRCNHLYHPRYVGHQVSAPLPAAIWAEPLVSAINNSLAVYEMSPAGTALEHQIVRWMCELAGFGEGAGGTLTSGGTEATFTALLAARAAVLPDAWERGVATTAGERPPLLVCGEHAHYAVTRAAGELGLGMRNVVVVPSRDRRMDPDALRLTLDAAARDGRQVMAVVATAGSTATGSFDALDAIGALCAERGIWLHVDGAHGASALLSSRHRHRVHGIERARTVAWDPHKMMLLPLSVGMLLARDERDLDGAFAQRAPYLFHGGDGERVWDQGTRSFQCSRRADALKLWVALQRYGTDGIGALYDHLCDIARAMYDAIAERADFEALHEPECNILCFRWVGRRDLADDRLDTLNRELRERYNRTGEGWITATNLDGRRVLRVTIMNPRTTVDDVRAVLDGLARVAKAI
jgi:L-2,4-diaminobutyrate decarboxylase